MFFFFDYKPLVAIIGDIKSSKQLEDRRAVQLKLKAVLDAVNNEYQSDLASKFMITLGDEFQGLLKSGTSAIFIIDKIEREMYPTKLRFGLGVGEITTDINLDMPFGADGPAYYNARKIIDELKVSEKKKMESKANVKIEVQGNAVISELINTILSLLTTIKETWTSRQVEIINSHIKTGGTQEDTARILNISQSNVAQALSAADYYTYRKAIETIAKVLSDIRENKDV